MLRVRATLAASAFLLLLLLSVGASGGPATCKILWSFNVTCSQPAAALVNQVETWSGRSCSDKGEKCMYEVVEQSASLLKIQHTSHRYQKTTMMVFVFFPPAASFCKMKAFTIRPQDATKPNDYCLFNNLITGSGLPNTKGFKENVTDTMCPPKKEASCGSKE